MKKTLQTLALFVFAAGFAQNIANYPSVRVPAKFTDFDQNKYKLNDLLISKLKAKKFNVITDESSVNNPCDALTADVFDTSNFLTNKVKVEFKDCRNTVVATYDGKSSLKEFEPGLREALEIALRNVPVSNPVKNDGAVAIRPESAEQSTAASNPVQTTSSNNQKKAELYTNGSLKLQKINISGDQFILANPDQTVPFAIFKATTKNDVFRVQLENGVQTLGYWENGNIVIEIPNSDGNYRKEVFELK